MEEFACKSSIKMEKLCDNTKKAGGFVCWSEAKKGANVARKFYTYQNKKPQDWGWGLIYSKAPKDWGLGVDKFPKPQRLGLGV